MNTRAQQVATVCKCIDQCFAYAFWCDDFAKHVDPEDMISGLDRGFEVVSDATRLHSFLALRKLDDFLAVGKGDDLVASTLGIDPKAMLVDVGERLLPADKRIDINKQVAHLTDRLTLDDNSEVDLDALLTRCIPVFSRLSEALRKADTSKEATQWLDKTDALIKRESEKGTSSQDDPKAQPNT